MFTCSIIHSYQLNIMASWGFDKIVHRKVDNRCETLEYIHVDDDLQYNKIVEVIINSILSIS